MLISANNLFAVNPADLTSFNRYFDQEFYMIAYDDGPSWASISYPTDNFMFSGFAWQNERRDVRDVSFSIARRLSEDFDLGSVLRGTWEEESFTPRADLVFDFRTSFFSLGALIPFQSEYDIKIGPRFCHKDTTAYLLFSEDSSHIFGLSYMVKSLLIEGAYEKDDIYYFRTSKGFKTSFGTFVPELRLKFTPTENFYGVGLGFCF